MPRPRATAPRLRFAAILAATAGVAIALAVAATGSDGRSLVSRLSAAGEPAPTCTTPFDIMQVLDESGSISATSFAQERSFAYNFANSFNFGPTATEMGVVMFATNARVALTLTANKTTALTVIGTIIQQGGNTDIAEGLALAQSHLDANGRAGVQDVLVLLTDGVQTEAGDPVAVAAAARAQGTLIFAIGVGSGVNNTQLQSITGDATHVFTVSTFSSLSALLDTLFVSICPGFGTATPTGTPTATLTPTATPTPTTTPTPTATASATPDCAQPPMSPPVAACLTDTPTSSPTPTPTLTPTSTPCPSVCPPTPTPDCTQPTSPPNAGCIDSDSDGVADAADNCPGIANTYQENTDAANTALNRPGADPFGDACDGDIDGDGLTNAQETTLGEDPVAYCPIIRANVDGDAVVSILDLTHVAQYFTQTIPPAPDRYRQDADGQISVLDLTFMALVFAQQVSACP